MQSQLKIALLILASFTFTTNAALGVDIAFEDQPITQEQFECMNNQGYDFVALQYYIGSEDYDSEFLSSYTAAQAAGFSDIEIFTFVTDLSGYLPGQIINKLNSIIEQAGFTGRLWFLVDTCVPYCWVIFPPANLLFINSLVQSAQDAGLDVGIRSDSYGWSQVTGGVNATTGSLSSLPLWYEDTDGSQNFDDDGYQFGGWTSAVMKQYNSSILCDVVVGLDWKP